MKSKLSVLSVLVLGLLFIVSCGDDVIGSDCDQWYEGDPCEKMVNKFLGNYTGGSSFCGNILEYEVTTTSNVINGLDIKATFTFQGNSNSSTYVAILTGSTTFQFLAASNQGGTGTGSLSGNNLSFTIGDANITCDHEGVRD